VISQGIELESQLLAFRADPSVSDKASAVGRGDHGIVLLSDLMRVLILDADRLHSVPRSWATSFRNWVDYSHSRESYKLLAVFGNRSLRLSRGPDGEDCRRRARSAEDPQCRIVAFEDLPIVIEAHPFFK
jgi:hypothetical protein